MKSARETAVELAALLTLCQTLQSEKDGVGCHAPSVFASDHETFSERIVEACMYTKMLNYLLPMHSQLVAVGDEMERQSKIRVNASESYARVALDHLLAQYLPGQSRINDCVAALPAFSVPLM
ncbi:Uncharacterised protein [Enterobacter cloacae]|uniref:hypothetical protein n=1 Tax=Enterobacteriaceae TaxID=543 RepID=UPI00079511BF|nr:MULTISPECIES: hypothetical protein [Enterobacteriaceae]CAE7770422.1 hypothetical protein AI2797V1_0419 [Enterobacter cloacae]MDK7082082.1 hypothetical protein [Enterobacter hormaechei]MDK7103225.1 hypothetical protein [Enterobacter hormaechei]MDK7621914.1 hypothetical protein [Enterobacter hormaechei]MDK7868744.1 hypothetical protein [Enterobacter hormaechei]